MAEPTQGELYSLLGEVTASSFKNKAEEERKLRRDLRRDQYKAGEVGQKEYENVLKIIDKDLEKFFGSVEVSTKNGQLFYDLTKDA